MPAEQQQQMHLETRTITTSTQRNIVATGPKWLQRRAIGQNNRPPRGGYGASCGINAAIGSTTTGPLLPPPQTTKDLVSRLKHESYLDGHSGCVNCLDWNQRGDLLASGSDDRDVIIWDPFKGIKRNIVHTGHRGNIFSVKFMPDFSDTYLATCASDGEVKLIDTLSQNVLMNCTGCHHDRVKRLAVHHNQPHLIWSAGEDGLIMQYDIREEHRCTSQLTTTTTDHNNITSIVSSAGKASSLLLDLKTDCLSMSAKCLAINPIRDEILAVGSNDIYTRLFDRRYIRRESTSVPTSSGTINSAVTAYFAPGHPLRQGGNVKPYSHGTTYLAFSPNGSELLVNMHAEQIYLFNTYEPQERYLSFETHLKPLILDHGAMLSNTSSAGSDVYKRNSKVKAHIEWEELRNHRKATDVPNEHKEFYSKIRQKLFDGIKIEMSEMNKLNELLSVYKNCPEFYQLRAGSLILRSWRGDHYQALRDSCCALALKPLYYSSLEDISEALYYLADKESAGGLLKMAEMIRREFGDDNGFLATTIESCEAILRNSPCNTDSHLAMESDGELSHDSSYDSRDLPSPPPLISEMPMPGDEILFMPHMLVDDPDLTSPEQLKDILKSQSKSEFQRRSCSFDYSKRFCGHCNLHTDIKEANFFGNNGEFIVAGSDDGALYIWDKSTGNIVKAVSGDVQILNCVQPHPRICMLATSGIESTVKIWSTSGKTCRDIKPNNLESRCTENQNFITVEPLEAMIMMLYPRTYS